MVTSTRKSATKQVVPKKARIDWDAVERDYRTGRHTNRELAEKYSVSHTAINKRARDNQWNQDLTDHIRQATNAKLTQAFVSTEVSKDFQNVSTAIEIAAAANAQIIHGHRARLATLHEAVETAKDKLMLLGDSVADIRAAATFVQAVGNLATATKTLIEQERKAHNLDAEQDTSEAGKQKRVLLEFVEANKP